MSKIVTCKFNKKERQKFQIICPKFLKNFLAALISSPNMAMASSTTSFDNLMKRIKSLTSEIIHFEKSGEKLNHFECVSKVMCLIEYLLSENCLASDDVRYLENQLCTIKKKSSILKSQIRKVSYLLFERLNQEIAIWLMNFVCLHQKPKSPLSWNLTFLNGMKTSCLKRQTRLDW